MIKKAKRIIVFEGTELECSPSHLVRFDDILAERESILDVLVFLKLNWGTTKGYERLKECINEMEAKK